MGLSDLIQTRLLAIMGPWTQPELIPVDKLVCLLGKKLGKWCCLPEVMIQYHLRVIYHKAIIYYLSVECSLLK